MVNNKTISYVHNIINIIISVFVLFTINIFLFFEDRYNQICLILRISMSRVSFFERTMIFLT